MSKPPDFGPGFHRAGRCFMWLIWLQSRLADFLCIRDARKRNDLALIHEYNESQRTGRPSLSYHKQVHRWSTKSLGTLIKEFQREWPEYTSDRGLSYAFKIAEIQRNAFAHAYMGNSDWLVFKPDKRTRTLIEDTGLPIGERMQGDPDFALMLPCFHNDFHESFYRKIRMIDFACFQHVADELGAHYVSTLNDPSWPMSLWAPPDVAP